MSQPPANSVPDYASQSSLSQPTPAPAAPLTPEQLLAVERAHTRARKVRRAATVATTDGAIMAIFTVLCLVTSIFDISGLILGVALAWVTYNSFRGANRLKRYDLSAPRLLALNQVFLAVAIIIYAIWSLHAAMNTPIVSAKELSDINQLSPDMGKFLKDGPRLFFEILYIGLIVGTVVAQGLTGLYYGTRATVLRAYLEETPLWIIELQKRQIGK